MSETLDELKQRTIDTQQKRAQKHQERLKERKPFFIFLPKAEKAVVNVLEVALIRNAMDAGQHEIILEALGVLANLKRIGQSPHDFQEGTNWDGCLKEVCEWYEAWKVVQEAMKGE